MKPLIIISGPTAVGKTAVSIKLAKLINGEIISADSMQVYKGMDIGSAKIKPEEMQGVAHFLIDIMSPFDDFNVAVFKDYANSAINEIYARNHIPIVVGGTGFYIQALLNDIDFNEEDGPDEELRARLEHEASEYGNDYLFDKLMAVDPKSCETIHKNNIKRVIRALEFYEKTKTPISVHNELMKDKESEFDYVYFVLNDIRDRVYENIDKRVDIMLNEGLVKEVTRLKDMGLTINNISMQGLGYKEIFEYLNGETSYEEAVNKIKLGTRHFAKRQLTWFRREENITFVNKNEFSYNEDDILDFMLSKINDKGII